MQSDVGSWIAIPVSLLGIFVFERHYIYRFQLLAAFAVFYWLLTVNRFGMWLPPENLMINDRVQTYYVLQTQDSDLVAFDSSRVTVVRINKASVKARVYCDDGPTGQLSEILFTQPTGRPICANAYRLHPVVE